MRPIWFIVGFLSVALGTVGVVVPLLPTVPFMILAAYCFARSSARTHYWLVNHRVFGPAIEDWNRSGAISKSGKYAATLSILVVFSISVVMGLKPMVLSIQAVTLCAVMLFIWTRPHD
ncbi:YbaN family protein [Alteromonas lipolytica]|uniref:Inner membrane protein n=1 Tax=Alteromonas lipolytica TaxID=1856405 RepID=A0A1E8FA35_9ALTE|nr:YbaN family protein [Alteromonas lipolytica]OFI32777.1 hypothetical protein BFC17_06400 [Alteromonas lipolytica]GGF73122.1 hypothetical protein GCM10011338_26640 [Alteromonas lipolytica]